MGLDGFSMDKWIDRWMDGWIDGWMDGRMDSMGVSNSKGFTVTRHSNDLSIHQWVRSAIHDSQQPTSPIGFLSLKLPPRLTTHLRPQKFLTCAPYSLAPPAYSLGPHPAFHNAMVQIPTLYLNFSPRLPQCHSQNSNSLFKLPPLPSTMP